MQGKHTYHLRTNSSWQRKQQQRTNESEHWQKLIGARKAKKARFGFNGIRIRVNFVQSSPFILDSELRHGISLWVQLPGEQVAHSPMDPLHFGISAVFSVIHHRLVPIINLQMDRDIFMQQQ